jgi:hypothetical protein
MFKIIQEGMEILFIFAKTIGMNIKKKVRIGNAGGFWGDDLNALNRQLTGGSLDYISIDYLAEITMSILRKQQLKNPETGYVTDFVNQIVENAALIHEKKVRIVTNAGGINPSACAKKISEQLLKKNIQLKIAVVEGDNIMDKIDEFYPAKCDFINMETGQPFSQIRDQIQSANVYLGILPLLKALETDADIIIAGRVTDTSITIAPIVYEFNWKLNDWDKLASALVAGHIIECGGQSTGGNFTDWQLIKKWDNFGYPIVEVYPDGSFIVTKHENTGGMVSLDTIREQLVYEMGNPSAYISPDVVVDFRTIHLEETGINEVKVFGIKGKPATPTYKVSMAYADGYKATSSIIVCGDNVLEKSKIFANSLWKRLNLNFEKNNVEFVGYNACHKELAQQIEPNEILLKFNVYDYDLKKIEEFSRNIAPLILTGPPGVAVTGGRPSTQEVMTYYPALIPKKLIHSTVKLCNEQGIVSETFAVASLTGFEENLILEKETKLTGQFQNIDFECKTIEMAKVKFRKICLARSGDKGDTSNIGVIARSQAIYEYLRWYLTADKIKTMFISLCRGKVIRFELDNLLALNFLLEESLDGGGTKSLMIDAQGKSYASALLNQYIDIPQSILNS